MADEIDEENITIASTKENDFLLIGENQMVDIIKTRKKNKSSCDLESLISVGIDKNITREEVISTLDNLTQKGVIESKVYAKWWLPYKRFNFFQKTFLLVFVRLNIVDFGIKLRFALNYSFVPEFVPFPGLCTNNYP